MENIKMNAITSLSCTISVRRVYNFLCNHLYRFICGVTNEVIMLELKNRISCKRNIGTYLVSRNVWYNSYTIVN